MVTDDVLAIDMEYGAPLALPSFPQFKLWPESAVALGEVAEALPLLHPDFDKRVRLVTQAFAQAALPLTHLYVLDAGTAPHVGLIYPQAALGEVMRHWYGARFGRYLLQVGDVASHFQRCASLVNQVSVRRLHRPACLSALPDLAQLVEQDLESGCNNFRCADVSR